MEPIFVLDSMPLLTFYFFDLENIVFTIFALTL